jgi:DnaJ like chaperone protein
MKFAKWIGGALGWTFGGPIGGLFGFALGAMFDGTSDSALTTDTQSRTRRSQTTAGDFGLSLLVLSAAVMKADGKHLKSELEFIKQFYIRQFGDSIAQQQIPYLKELLQKDIPLYEVCMQIRQHMLISHKLQLIHYLFGIALADGDIHKTELDVISQIASYLGISEKDFTSIKAMFVKDVNADYKILEIDPSASDDEVRKAYRRMAMKYHPDKVTHLGEEFQKSAKEKFQKLQEAYENIKRSRGII